MRAMHQTFRSAAEARDNREYKNGELKTKKDEIKFKHNLSARFLIIYKILLFFNSFNCIVIKIETKQSTYNKKKEEYSSIQKSYLVGSESLTYKNFI